MDAPHGNELQGLRSLPGWPRTTVQEFTWTAPSGEQSRDFEPAPTQSTHSAQLHALRQGMIHQHQQQQQQQQLAATAATNSMLQQQQAAATASMQQGAGGAMPYMLQKRQHISNSAANGMFQQLQQQQLIQPPHSLSDHLISLAAAKANQDAFLQNAAVTYLGSSASLLHDPSNGNSANTSISKLNSSSLLHNTNMHNGGSSSSSMLHHAVNIANNNNLPPNGMHINASTNNALMSSHNGNPNDALNSQMSQLGLQSQHAGAGLMHQLQPQHASLEALMFESDADILSSMARNEAGGMGSSPANGSGTDINGSNTSSASLYVKNLSPDTDELYLYQKFSPHGALLSCKVKTDPTNGKCRGVGFVNYVDQACALRAMQQLHGSRTAEGRQLHITLQAPRAMRAAAAAAAAGPGMGSTWANLPTNQHVLHEQAPTNNMAGGAMHHELLLTWPLTQY